MTPPFGKCVWGCDSDAPLNEEHIIAHQVAKALDLPFPLRAEWGAIHRPTGTQRALGHSLDDDLEIAIKDRVCKRCNGQWMNKLDKRMLAFMRASLRHGARIQLKDTQQRTLAHWATKVGLLIALWFHDDALHNPDAPQRGSTDVPDDNFLSVGKHMKPPERTRVWIGAVDDREDSFFMSADPILWGRPQDDAPAEVGYSAVFSLKTAVFYVAGWKLDFATPHPDWPNPEKFVGGSRVMRRIWPIRERVVEWPPPQKMPADGLYRLVSQ